MCWHGDQGTTDELGEMRQTSWKTWKKEKTHTKTAKPTEQSIKGILVRKRVEKIDEQNPKKKRHAYNVR